MKLFIRILLFVLLINISSAYAAVKTTVCSGDWNSASTWSPSGVPTATDEVVIKGSHAPTINSGNIQCSSITIQQGATIVLNAGQKMSVASTGGITIEGTLSIEQGAIDILIPGTSFIISSTGKVTWNPANNTLAGASLFTNCIEHFAPTSTLIIKKWYDTKVGLGSVIQGNFGNVTITNINGWRMNNTLEQHQIAGELTITNSHVILDTTGTISHTYIGSINLTNASSFLDFYSGERDVNYTVNTGNITINGGELDINYGSESGSCSLLVNGNIQINNNGYLIGASYSNAHINISVSGNLCLTRSNFMGVKSGNGNATIKINGNLIVQKSGTTYSEFYGIVDGNGNATVTIEGNFNNQGYSNLIWNTGITGVGNGNASLNVSGRFIQSDGDFRGTWNATTTNAGHCVINIDSMEFNGGIFMGTYSCSNSTDTVSLNFSGSCSINFNKPGDIFRGVGMATLCGTPNTQRLKLTSSGNFAISGNGSAEFSSSYGYGHEINILSASFSISGGLNKFGGSAHTTTIQTGDVFINGGLTTLSDNTGISSITMKSFNQQGGVLNLKNNLGACTLSIQNTFTQSEGTLVFYSNSVISNPDAVVLSTTGNFTQNGGILCFSKCATQTGKTVLQLNCETYSITGNGTLTSAGAGTAPHFGIIQLLGDPLSRKITINSSSNAHLTEQVKYVIGTQTKAKLNGEYFRLSSHQNIQNDMLLAEHLSELDAGTTILESNGSFNNCGITIKGNLITQHPNGLFNGSENATISSKSGMDYSLDQDSKVTYSGTGHQLLSGYGYGGKSGEQHKYGTLAIHGKDLILLLDKNVVVRQFTELISGDINLNNYTFYSGDLADVEHNGGFIFNQNQSIIKSKVIIGRPSPYGTGFSHVNLPLRDSLNGVINIQIKSTSNPSNALLSFATRSTPPDNLPLPGADHVNAVNSLNPGGGEISVMNIIDRYYEIDANGINADYTLFYNGRENTTGSTVCKSNIVVSNWNGTCWKNIATTSYGDTISSRYFKTGFHANNLKGPVIFKLTGATIPNNTLTWKAVAEPDANKCSWVISGGKEYELFIIERSTDNQHFMEIGKVNANVSQGNVRNYSFYDQNPPDSIGFYRLKQIEKSGDYEYSSTIELNRQSPSLSGTGEISISTFYPNPFNDQFSIEYSLKSEGTISFRLYNMKGQILLTKEESQQAGPNTFKAGNLEHLPPGSYLLHVTKGTEMITRKLIKTTN